MKLYLVWSGSYSDKELCGIYSTMEKAQEAHEQFDADNDIEERESDEMPEHPPGMTFWNVAMKKDGSLWHGQFNYPTPSRESSRGRTKEYYDPDYDWTAGVSKKTAHVVFHVWARDAEHAIKIANERRVQLIATNEWTDDYGDWMKRIHEAKAERP
jgi:hypothetical protein